MLTRLKKQLTEWLSQWPNVSDEFPAKIKFQQLLSMLLNSQNILAGSFPNYLLARSGSCPAGIHVRNAPNRNGYTKRYHEVTKRSRCTLRIDKTFRDRLATLLFTIPTHTVQ